MNKILGDFGMDSLCEPEVEKQKEKWNLAKMIGRDIF